MKNLYLTSPKQKGKAFVRRILKRIRKVRIPRVLFRKEQILQILVASIPRARAFSS